jgi:hypothetical protein
MKNWNRLRKPEKYFKSYGVDRDMSDFFFRLSLIIVFEICTWMVLRRRIGRTSERSIITITVIQFAMLYGIFLFLYLNFIVHPGALRLPPTPDTPLYIHYFYSQGKLYGYAPGPSIIIILVDSILRWLDSYASVQYGFSLILPILLVLTVYSFFEEFTHPKNSFTATIIFVQVDMIIESFTTNVKQDLAVVILLVSLKFLFKYKNGEVGSRGRHYDFWYSMLCFSSAIMLLFTHLFTFVISLAIVPVFLVQWKVEDRRINIKPTKEIFIWPSAAFLILLPHQFQSPFPFRLYSTFLYTDLPGYIGDISEILGISPETTAFLTENTLEIFVMASFGTVISILLLLYFLCWFWSTTTIREIYANAFVLIPMCLAFFLVYTLVYHLSLERWYRDWLAYVVLSIPRITMLTFSVYFVANVNTNRNPLQFAKNMSENEKNGSLAMHSFTITLLFVFGGLFMFYAITGFSLGQLERRWLDLVWIPIAWLAARLIDYYEINHSRLTSNLMITFVMSLCILSVILGSKDLLFFNPYTWNIRS